MKIWILFIALGLCYGGCIDDRNRNGKTQQHFDSIHAERFGNHTPARLTRDFSLLNLRTREKIMFSTLKDSLLIVSFWEYFCKPCIEELPTMVELKKKLNMKSVRLVLVSERYPDKVLASPVFQNREVDFFHVAYSQYDSAFDNSTDFIPRTYFVDSYRNLIFYDWMGGTNYNDSAIIKIVNNYFHIPEHGK